MQIDNRKTVIIVDPYSSGNLFLDEFHKRGCRVVAVLTAPKPPDVYASSYKEDGFDKIFVSSEWILVDLVDVLREFKPIYVFAGCESGVELADQLAPPLLDDRFNDPELAAARRDKWEMAKAVANAGVPVMRQICSKNFSDVQAWVRKSNLVNTSLVVKPPKSASTDSVVKVNGDAELEVEFLKLIGKKNRLGIINDMVLVQEYLEGQEYVVDTFSFGGVHTLCSVCKYTKISNNNGMAIYDRMDWIDYDDQVVADLFLYAEDVLNAVGIRWGSAHIEIMWTTCGPRLIELAARPHGGGHPKLSYLATGDSTVHRTVEYFVNGVEPPRNYYLFEHMVVVFFRAECLSVVVGVDRLYSLNSLPSYLDSLIKVKDNDLIPATVDLFGTLAIGFVVLKNRSRDQIEKDICEIRLIESLVFQCQ
ncbi:hypothetical protein NS2R_04645 [Pseudomonas oryzihabitans]|nr:hypothetical protein NS2R_04645 [Pseudomonas psychrotolerans]